MLAHFKHSTRHAARLSSLRAEFLLQSFSRHTGREGTSADELSSDPNVAPPKESQSKQASKGAAEGHQKVPTEEEVIRQGKENQQDTPKHSDMNASKDISSGHAGGSDEGIASNSSEDTQKNKAADDPSTDTAQKLKQTSADEKDMAATS